MSLRCIISAAQNTEVTFDCCASGPNECLIGKVADRTHSCIVCSKNVHAICSHFYEDGGDNDSNAVLHVCFKCCPKDEISMVENICRSTKFISISSLNLNLFL